MVVRTATPRHHLNDGPVNGSYLLNGDSPSVAYSTPFSISASGNSPENKASVPRAPEQLTHSSAARIVDIRSSRGPLLDLGSKTLEGLRQPDGSKSMPSLLLWDETGQGFYDEILSTGHYYPYHVEKKLLKQQAYEMASTVMRAGTNMLIELGAGNMQKTTLFLAALDDCLDAPLVYYALDVDQAELERSLLSLRERTNLRHIELRGLLGTYDDGARWLSSPETRHYRKTLMWIGSSIANLGPHEAAELLGSFASNAPGNGIQNLAGFLLAADGCQDETMIECAYDTPGGQSRRWIKYALEAARRNLCDPEAEKLLDDDNWRVVGRWDSQQQRYGNYLVAARHLHGTIRGEEVRVSRGERVHLLSSSKWTKSDVSSICSGQGLDVVNWWKSEEVDYGIYWLESGPRRTDSGVARANGSENGS